MNHNASLLQAFFDLVEIHGCQGVDIHLLARQWGHPIADLPACIKKPLDCLKLLRLDMIQSADRWSASTAHPLCIKDRFFDLIMTVLDDMAPYQKGLRRLNQEALNFIGLNPTLASLWDGGFLDFEHSLLRQTGVGSPDPLIDLCRSFALKISFIRVFTVWVEEDNGAMPATLRRLDEVLDQLQNDYGYPFADEG